MLDQVPLVKLEQSIVYRRAIENFSNSMLKRFERTAKEFQIVDSKTSVRENKKAGRFFSFVETKNHDVSTVLFQSVDSHVR